MVLAPCYGTLETARFIVIVFCLHHKHYNRLNYLNQTQVSVVSLLFYVLIFNFYLHDELTVQVEAEKSELQQQLEWMGGGAGLLECSETVSYQRVDVALKEKQLRTYIGLAWFYHWTIYQLVTALQERII